MSSLIVKMIKFIHGFVPQFIVDMDFLSYIRDVCQYDKHRIVITEIKFVDGMLIFMSVLCAFWLYGMFRAYFITFVNRIHPAKMYQDANLEFKEKIPAFGYLNTNRKLLYYMFNLTLIEYLVYSKVGRILEVDFDKEVKEEIDI